MISKQTTQQLLADSLIDLLSHKSIDKITVKEIAQNCGLGRQTFYNHFSDKYELITWFYEFNIDNIIKQNFASTWGHTLGEILIFMKEYHRFFNEAFTIDRQQPSFIKTAFIYCKKTYENIIIHNTKKQVLPSDFHIKLDYICYGAVNVVYDWIKDGMIISPKEIGEILANMIPYEIQELMPF